MEKGEPKVVPIDDDELSLYPPDWDAADAEETLRSFEVYNEDHPTDLDDIDVFSTHVSTKAVDGDKTAATQRRKSMAMAPPEDTVYNFGIEEDAVTVGESIIGFEIEHQKDTIQAAEEMLDHDTDTKSPSSPQVVPGPESVPPPESYSEDAPLLGETSDKDCAPAPDLSGTIEPDVCKTHCRKSVRLPPLNSPTKDNNSTKRSISVLNRQRKSKLNAKSHQTNCMNLCRSDSIGQLEKVSSTYLKTFEETDQDAKPRGASDGTHIGVRTRARRSLIHRTWGMRVLYTFVLCNLIVWIPAWLKLLTISRRETIKHRVSIFNNSIGMDLYVSTFDGQKDNVTKCNKCDATRHDGAEFGVTYEIKAKLDDYYIGEGISTASYIVLLASYNFRNWYVVGKPAILKPLQPGDSVVDVCQRDPMPAEEDEWMLHQLEDDDDDDDATTTSKSSRGNRTSADDDDEVEDPYDDYHISRCCLDKPGFIYLVACATPYEYLADPRLDFYWELKDGGPQLTTTSGSKMEGSCVAVSGRCGAACGADARVPIPGTCVNGEIPMEHLIDERFLTEASDSDRRTLVEVDEDGTTNQVNDQDEEAIWQQDLAEENLPKLAQEESIDHAQIAEEANDDLRRRLASRSNRRRHFDRRKRMKSSRTIAYHVSFILFVTMSAIGTWVSFLAGCGLIDDDVKPTMSCVEAYLAQDDKTLSKKPLLLCAFSISASEPAMMIVRNMTGKLMAWVYQRKFILSMPNSNFQNVFAGTQDPRAGFRAVAQQNYEKQHANLSTHCEYIDIFQDEGHRVGCYALWDAFVYMINDSDLRFLECMANKMDKMTAEQKMLIGKTVDDGKCLDDELRAMTKIPEIGITEEQINVFELAFMTFDLLTALGHPAFWRNDRKLHVASFRSLANTPKAVDALRIWAENFAKEKKRNGKMANPFAINCAPTEHEGICANVWNGWWCLYDEMGRIQFAKRYDTTKFWNCRLNYFRRENENVQHDLMFCYSARANPEDVNYKLAPTAMLRGVSPGVFIRLRQTDTENMNLLFKWIGIEPLSRSKARRCHARVVGSRFTMLERGTQESGEGEEDSKPRRMVFVKVKECTPEFLAVLPKKYLTNQGQSKYGDFDEVKQNAHLREKARGYRFEGEEAIVPLACIQPLRESRGKSGGMNHAMEILNYYLRYESSTFKLLEAKRAALATRRQRKKSRRAIPVPENDPSHPTEACLLFAIFDCRHMAVQGFWNAVIPYFYHYKDPNNPWDTDLQVDHNVAFVQMPQSFSSLTIDDDIFDMRNEYLFRLANNIRSGVGAITSCGTNAVWNYDIRFQHDPLLHRFNEDTMIEDTASSHDVIIAGRKGIYHFERLVLGARKGTTDYLAAVFRWSKGAVQLFWTTFWYPRYKYRWPYAMLFVQVTPLIGCVIYLQTQTLDQCHRTYLASRLNLLPCGQGPVLGIITDPVYIFFVLSMVSVAVTTFYWPRLGAFTVMFENVTYFFSSTSAFYWAAMPVTMCVARHGLPSIFDNQLVTAGALWMQLHCAILINTIKSWSPLENGAAPSDQSLLRSQQMYLITAPLHLLAIIQGMKEGFQICFLRKDASRWGSFDSTLAMSTVKIWVVSLLTVLIVSIIVGGYNLAIYDRGYDERGVRSLGIFFASVLLYIVFTPIKAMFFYDRVVREKKKPSIIDRVTAAIFGKKTPVRPDYVYLLLWVSLLAFSLRRKEINNSEGVLNGRSRCGIDPNLPGCGPDDLYLHVRNGGKGIIPRF